MWRASGLHLIGPTLFLIYINDLPTVTKLLDPILYANDTNLFFRSKNLNLHINTINNELELIKNWCNLNKLTLNLEKTNYLVLQTPQNKCTLNLNSIKISDSSKRNKFNQFFRG